MLIEFRVKNHRSIRTEQVFTMEAGRVGDSDDPRPRQVTGHGTSLLPVAAFYGANASGKSNLFSALGFMCDAVVHSHRVWPPDGGVPRDPFRWGTAATQDSLFEATFLVDGIRYQYGFVAGNQSFVEEWLYAWPKGRKQTWIEREGSAFKFGQFLQGENRIVEQVTRENALFLSAAAQHKHEQLTPIYRWFRALRTIGVPRMSDVRPTGDSLIDRGLWRLLEAVTAMSYQPSLFDEDSRSGSEVFKALLRAADVGIVDLKLEEADDEVGASRRPPRIMVQHRNASGEAWLPLGEESQGTLTLLRVGPLLIEALLYGGVTAIDELEDSLHPLLALQLVKLFNDPSTNPLHAQLLFTTHDTNLLGTMNGEPALRRDQVWLTEKDHDGATCVYPLTDYKPRKAENIERGYLQGRFGAIPYLGELVRPPGC